MFSPLPLRCLSLCLGAGELALALGLALRGHDLREHVRLAEDQVLLRTDLDFGAAVLRVDDLVTDLHVQRDVVYVLVTATRADREHAAALGLLFRRVRKDDAAHRGLLLFEGFDDEPISERLQIHTHTPPRCGLCDICWHSPIASAEPFYNLF